MPIILVLLLLTWVMAWTLFLNAIYTIIFNLARGILSILSQPIRLIDWLIDLNGKSTSYSMPRSWRIIFIFFVRFLKSFCTWSNRMQIVFIQIDLTHRCDSNRYDHSRSEWFWEWWQWRRTLHCPDLQNWSFTIRYCVMS